MKILVEYRNDPRCAINLDYVAATLVQMGHTVSRWKGPFCEGSPCDPIEDCDAVIFWNGMHDAYTAYVHQAGRRGIRTFFMELGAIDQDQTFQIDPSGVNAAASWSIALSQDHELSMGMYMRRWVSVKPGTGPLLVILQDDTDVQITKMSPHFTGMASWLTHLATLSRLEMVVRPHPHSPPSTKVRMVVDRCHRMTWDASESLDKAIEASCAVATINSTCGLRAIQMGRPVLCYGLACYRVPGVVMCMGTTNPTAEITSILRDGQDLGEDPSSRTRLLELVAKAQWKRDGNYDRLAALLAA